MNSVGLTNMLGHELFFFSPLAASGTAIVCEPDPYQLKRKAITQTPYIIIAPDDCAGGERLSWPYGAGQAPGLISIAGTIAEHGARDAAGCGLDGSWSADEHMVENKEGTTWLKNSGLSLEKSSMD